MLLEATKIQDHLFVPPPDRGSRDPLASGLGLPCLGFKSPGKQCRHSPEWEGAGSQSDKLAGMGAAVGRGVRNAVALRQESSPASTPGPEHLCAVWC